MRALSSHATVTGAAAGAAVLLLVLVLASSVALPGLHRRPPAADNPPPRGTALAQRGFAIPVYSRDGYRSPQVATGLGQLAALGATWVQVNPTWYQRDARASAIGPLAQTPSDASVRHIVETAHRAGLRVFLKPLLDLGPDGGGYRGTIRPTDRAAWFASYTAFITHYAEMAARLGVAEFAVGTELAGSSADRAGWLGVVRAVRARYRGLLLYAANFDEYRRVAFWDAVDLVGIDAYWPVSARPTTDVRALGRAWDPIVRELAGFAGRTGRLILFTEAGYTSQRGSSTAPWSWTNSRTPDQAEQAAAYQALLSSLSERPWWAGVFWWAWDSPPNPSDPLDYSPHGKAAEAVVRRWWG